jgi:hypothetical protein
MLLLHCAQALLTLFDGVAQPKFTTLGKETRAIKTRTWKKNVGSGKVSVGA